ncbi:hypothetical protein ABEB36_000928 [Hypothenemus hampei]|uniref:Insulin-like domain-containing protein n=1 Tax=Hypothenemus hampei TaxID=57062 RepID=A0ABD1FFJ8_HYPHA
MSTNFPVVFYLLVLVLLFSNCDSKRISRPHFNQPANYCGPRLTQQLHDFCEIFYGPSDITQNQRRHAVAEECCESPCSILYIILTYCKTPKKDVIRRTFGDEEVRLYESLSGSKSQILNPITESVIRKKKHIPKRKKKRCPCRKNANVPKHKPENLKVKLVPQYLLGFADYHENDPIIITENL